MNYQIAGLLPSDQIILVSPILQNDCYSSLYPVYIFILMECLLDEIVYSIYQKFNTFKLCSTLHQNIGDEIRNEVCSETTKRIKT